MIGTFPEKYGRAGTEHPDFGIGIRKMRADAPVSPMSEESRRPRQEAPAVDLNYQNTVFAPAVPLCLMTLKFIE